MSAPTSPNNSSPATPGSPYQPLCVPQPTCDLHSLFCQQTGTSTSSTVAPIPSTEPTPSCSYAVTSSPSTSSTADTASCLKRLLESSESSEPPRKRLRKQKHTTPPTTSPQGSPSKRKRSSSSSSSEEEAQKEDAYQHLRDPKLTQRPGGVQTWLWASRFTFGPYHGDRSRINQQVLAQMQEDLCNAYDSIEEEEKTAAQVLNSIYESTPPIDSNRLPIVLFKRRQRTPTRLCWKKLRLSLSYLSCTQGSGSSSRIGNENSTKAVHWLSLFIKRTTPFSRRPRTLISGMAFTRLCGTALAAQNITPARTAPAPLSAKDSLRHLASSDDLALAMNNISHITAEPGFVFLRNNDGTREVSESQRQRRTTYPIYDFDDADASASTSNQTDE